MISAAARSRYRPKFFEHDTATSTSGSSADDVRADAIDQGAALDPGELAAQDKVRPD
jgi:hypothetical protein